MADAVPQVVGRRGLLPLQSRTQTDKGQSAGPGGPRRSKYRLPGRSTATEGHLDALEARKFAMAGRSFMGVDAWNGNCSNSVCVTY